jgi:hypothetical protein
MGCSSCGSDEATCQTLAHSGAALGACGDMAWGYSGDNGDVMGIEWGYNGDRMGIFMIFKGWSKSIQK